MERNHRPAGLLFALNPCRLSSAWVFCLVSVVFIATGLHAAQGFQSWVKRYPNGAGKKIAVDRDGNVVVGGNFNYDGIWGQIIKYSSNGWPLWTNSIVGTLVGLVADPSGNVVAEGHTWAAMGVYSDYVTILYSAAGTPLWTNRYKGQWPRGNFSSDVATDGSGNIYVTGFCYTGLDDSSYLTLAYSCSGALLWTNSSHAIFSQLDPYPPRVRADPLGHIYVSGTLRIEGTAFGTFAYSNTGATLWSQAHPYDSYHYPSWAEAQATAADSKGNLFVSGHLTNHLATVGFSGNGTLLWLSVFAQWSQAASMGTDDNGNVYVTGYRSRFGSDSDFLTLAYSGSGIPLWTNYYSRPDSTNNYPQALAVGSDGNIYVTGYSGNGGSDYDYLTLAYSNGGLPLWTNRFSGPTNGLDQAFALAVDRSGNVYVTGSSQGDCTTIKYSPVPTILLSADTQPGQNLRLTIAAPANAAYRLEASTNLVNWVTLTNLPPLPSTTLEYTETFAPGTPARFYRTLWTPE